MQKGIILGKEILTYILFSLLLVSPVTASVIDDLEAFKNEVGINEPLIILLVRAAILFLVAFLLYEGLSKVGLSQGTSVTISFLIALMGAVFIPGGVLVGIASTYATVISFVFILA